jgi:hypothetical protein
MQHIARGFGEPGGVSSRADTGRRRDERGPSRAIAELEWASRIAHRVDVEPIA